MDIKVYLQDGMTFAQKHRLGLLVQHDLYLCRRVQRLVVEQIISRYQILRPVEHNSIDTPHVYP